MIIFTVWLSMGCGRLYFTRGGLLPTSYGGLCSWLAGWLMWEGLSCCSEGLVMFMLLYQQKCDRGLFSCNDDVTYRSVCPSVEETLMCGGHSDVAISARSGKDKRLAMTWNSYLLCTLCVQEWKCAAMEVFWLLPLNSTRQNVTGSVLSHVLYIIICGSMNRVIEELIAMGGNSDLSFDITHPQNGMASLFQHLTILTLC